MRVATLVSNLRVTLVAALGVGLMAGISSAESPLETIDREVSALYARSQQAIVRVHAERSDEVANASLTPAHRVGTGFFVDGDGRLLTAGAVVENAGRCWIDYQGQRVPARVLGRDAHTNLALLQVDSKQTPFLTLGNSEDLRVGCMVVAVGFPYNLPGAPVVGFVTGFDIRQGTRVFPVSHVRASCRLSPGQSGSPLFNVRGEVVGVALAAHLDDQCHALPINAARRLYIDIRDHGAPQRGQVGLNVGERQMGDVPSGPWQVFVQDVSPNSPAARAGFRAGDVLLRIAANDVHRIADVLDRVFYLRRGDQTSFTVLRDGQPVELAVTVAGPPKETPSLPPPQWAPAAGSR